MKIGKNQAAKLFSRRGFVRRLATDWFFHRPCEAVNMVSLHMYGLDANSPHRNPETICSSGKTDD
ncbi:Uncharacterized protein APZ42_000197 [Daphnia magna]|uniref:Uncharacterized protein n=1 Tax=Daphnia magna TaxID=35525 RepID=A0A164JUN7_9CRUS|nr:Uncharacterized protein APZ42_000197 [Daphnia magna]